MKVCHILIINIFSGFGLCVKIVGNIRIENNVVISVNCVFKSDVPYNSAIVGISCEIISTESSVGHINRIDYNNLIKR